MKPSHWALVATCAVVLLTGTLSTGQDLGDFGTWVWSAVGVCLLGGALVVVTAFVLREGRLGTPALMVLLFLAVAFRLALLPSQRHLSDDAFRYHWDGKVASAGINPYSHAPDDPALDSLRTEPTDLKINHPDRHTVYPPLAQAYFLLAVWLAPEGLSGFQILLLLSEIAAWLLLVLVLRAQGRSEAWVLLAAWSPLVIYESYLPGHLDALALPWLTLLILALDRERPVFAGLMLALSCLIKPVSLIFVPALVRQLSRSSSSPSWFASWDSSVRCKPGRCSPPW
jgi:hypothetical protein